MDRKLLKLETAARRGGSSVRRAVVMGMLSTGAAFGGQTWKANPLSFRDGCGIRIADADRLDLATFGKPRTLVTATMPFASVPPVTFVASDGTIRGTGNGWGGWTVVRSADGSSLLLSGNPGTIVILR